MRGIFVLYLALSTFMASAAARAETPDEKSNATTTELTETYRFATSVYGANADDHALRIMELGPKGLRELGRSVGINYQGMLWLDGHTLLAVENADDGWSIVSFVDGAKTNAVLSVPQTSFALKKNETAPRSFDMVLDKKGQLWLEACVRWDKDMEVVCEATVWLAIDYASSNIGKTTRKAPPGVKRTRPFQYGVDPSSLPKIKAPVGYKVKLHTQNLPTEYLMVSTGKNVPSFTCTSPSGAVTWPHADVIDWQFHTRPKRARWIMDNPPILWVEGPSTNPIGMTGPSERYFRGCAAHAMESVVILGPNTWLELVEEPDGAGASNRLWAVYVGTKRIGTVNGDTSGFASTRL